MDSAYGLRPTSSGVLLSGQEYWPSVCGHACCLSLALHRLDRVHGVYNKRRGAEYPFWSSVMLDYVLYWFLFSVLGELFYITADASTLNT